MIVRTARSAAALAVATLLAAVTALLVLPGMAHAKDLDCRNFATQEEAQAYLNAHPGDPDNLDSNGDGVACETRPHLLVGGPTTTTRTTTTTPPVMSTTTTTALAGATTTNTTTSTTEGATTSTRATSTTTTTTAESDSNSDSDSGDSSSGTSDNDRDCADFASQADAQAVLDADLTDPEGLDADLDGIACEDHFGGAGQQVQVHPSGGVDTGGGPAGA